MTLGILLNFSEPDFPHLQTEANNVIYFTTAIRTKKENMPVSTGPENKCSIGTNFFLFGFDYILSHSGEMIEVNYKATHSIAS